VQISVAAAEGQEYGEGEIKKEVRKGERGGGGERGEKIKKFNSFCALYI
jgi:hypothetical protein